MKLHDINILFSKKVADYIGDGYIINTQSMGGSQGEVGKVDLVKGHHLIRIWLNKETAYNWHDREKFSGDMVVLRVSEWKHPAEDNIKQGYTVWMSELEHIETHVFYQISNYDTWYVEDLQEAIAAQKLRRDRYYNRNPKHDEPVTTDAMKEIGAKYLKHKAGYKRVRKEEIKIQKGDKSYCLMYAGKTYKIK